MTELRDKRGLTEAEAIEAYRKKNYPKPALTADVCIFARSGAATIPKGLSVSPKAKLPTLAIEDCPTRHRASWKVLLIRRGGHPYLGCWALPGGFADQGETIEATAARELMEETGLTGLGLQLVGVYSAPGRDPRGWTVSVAYATRAEAPLNAVADDDAAEAGWFDVALPEGGPAAAVLPEGQRMAFDHAQIIADAAALLLV